MYTVSGTNNGSATNGRFVFRVNAHTADQCATFDNKCRIQIIIVCNSYGQNGRSRETLWGISCLVLIVDCKQLYCFEVGANVHVVGDSILIDQCGAITRVPKWRMLNAVYFKLSVIRIVRLTFYSFYKWPCICNQYELNFKSSNNLQWHGCSNSKQ